MAHDVGFLLHEYNIKEIAGSMEIFIFSLNVRSKAVTIILVNLSLYS